MTREAFETIKRWLRAFSLNGGGSDLVHGMQEVIGSSPLSSTCRNLFPNRDLRYLTTFVSAVKCLIQSWKNFHEMKGTPAYGQKTERFAVVSTSQAEWTSPRPNQWT